MLSSLLTLGLAAGIGMNASDTTAAKFVANLTPDAEASSAMSNAEGTASITLSNQSIQYRLSLRNLKHVTDIAVVDAGRAISLVSPGDTRSATMDVEGSVPTTSADGIPFDELLTDMKQGKAQVVVFTTNEPGGAVEGKLEPGTSAGSEDN